jgi:hypothetical protein
MGAVAPAPVRKRPRGHAIEWDDEDVRGFLEDFDEDDADEMAEDAGRETNALWKAGAILAVVGAVASNKKQSTYKWNPGRQRYVRPDASVVNRSSIRRAVDAVSKVAVQGMRRTGQDLIDGRISIPHMQNTARKQLTAAQVLATGIARGGKGQLTSAATGAVADLARRDYDALARLAADLESGKIPAGGRMMQRLALIGKTARNTFYNAERIGKAEAGFEQAKRVLAFGESCEDSADRDGCTELAALGWVDIEDLVPIGDATCLSNCRCEVIYRVQPVDAQGEPIKEEEASEEE